MKIDCGRLSTTLLSLCAVHLAFGQSDATVQADHSVYIKHDQDVQVQLDANPGGVYNNEIDPVTQGDGMNYVNQLYQSYTDSDIWGSNWDLHLSVTTESTANTGFASQFNGINYFLDFTNNGSTIENAYFTDSVYQHFGAVGTATAVAYAGWQFFNPYSNSSVSFYTSNGLNGDGSGSGLDLFGQQFPSNNGFVSYDFGTYVDASSDYVLHIQPGDTITVEFWSAGSTQAGTPQAVPEAPAWVLGLLIAPVLFRRRR